MEYFSPKGRKGIESKSKTITRRAFFLSLIKSGFFGIIFSRLFYLQVIKKKDYQLLSDRNRYRELKEVPQRGNIVDFKGKVLASNNQVYQLEIFPREIKNLDEFFYSLKNYVFFDVLELRKFKRDIYRHKRKNKFLPFIIDKKLDWKTISRINYNLNDIPYIRPIVLYERTYKNPESFAHILGYVSVPNEKDLKNLKKTKDA